MASLDHQKFVRVVALFASDKEGERAAALTIANKMLAATGLSWVDFIEADRRASEAEQVALMAIAEMNEVKTRLAELEQSSGEWIAVPIQSTPAARTANWVMSRWAAGEIWLTEWEIRLLDILRHWVGPPSPRQAPHLQRIVDRITTRTGKQPPP